MWMRIGIVAVVMGMIVGGAAVAQEKDAKPQAPGTSESNWRVGIAKVKITPDKPVLMAGYASRTDPSREVAGELYVKAMAIEDAQKHRAVLVTADLIGFRKDVTEQIAARLMQKHGLKRDQLLFNASHTHSGPDMSISAEDAKKSEGHADTHAWIERFKDRTVEAVEAAMADMKPAQLSWSSNASGQSTAGVVNFVMNRRELTPTGVKLGVNPRGYVDRSVPVLRVEDMEGKLRGVLFGTACHNTTLTGQNYAIHGDYAGAAQQRIEAAFPGAGVIAMFMIGCGGDANPHPRGRLENAEQHGEELANEVLRVLETKFTPVTGELRTQMTYIDLPLTPVPSRDKLEEIARSGASYQKFMAAKMIVELEQGREIASHYRAPVALWQFGEDLTLVGLPGETTSGYIQLVEQELGPRKLWIAGYCNDVFGYLPTADVLQGGGYETRGLYWGGLGTFTEEAQNVVQEAVGRLAKEAGRE